MLNKVNDVSNEKKNCNKLYCGNIYLLIGKSSLISTLRVMKYCRD